MSEYIFFNQSAKVPTMMTNYTLNYFHNYMETFCLSLGFPTSSCFFGVIYVCGFLNVCTGDYGEWSGEAGVCVAVL